MAVRAGHFSRITDSAHYARGLDLDSRSRSLRSEVTARPARGQTRLAPRCRRSPAPKRDDGYPDNSQGHLPAIPRDTSTGGYFSSRRTRELPSGSDRRHVSGGDMHSIADPTSRVPGNPPREDTDSLRCTDWAACPRAIPHRPRMVDSMIPRRLHRICATTNVRRWATRLACIPERPGSRGKPSRQMD